MSLSRPSAVPGCHHDGRSTLVHGNPETDAIWGPLVDAPRARRCGAAVTAGGFPLASLHRALGGHAFQLVIVVERGERRGLHARRGKD